MDLAKTTARWDEKHLSFGIDAFCIRDLTVNLSNHPQTYEATLALPDDVLWSGCVRCCQVRCQGLIDQSHRYGRPQAACPKPAGSHDKTTWTAICFEHKTQYLLIRAPYTRIVVFWHISNIPPWLRRVKLVVIPQQYLWNIAIQLAVGCYNSWANLRCSGCYPLGEKLLWNRSIMDLVGWDCSPLTSMLKLKEGNHGITKLSLK